MKTQQQTPSAGEQANEKILDAIAASLARKTGVPLDDVRTRLAEENARHLETYERRAASECAWPYRDNPKAMEAFARHDAYRATRRWLAARIAFARRCDNADDLAGTLREKFGSEGRMVANIDLRAYLDRLPFQKWALARLYLLGFNRRELARRMRMPAKKFNRIFAPIRRAMIRRVKV